jgi:hypothetical protein
LVCTFCGTPRFGTTITSRSEGTVGPWRDRQAEPVADAERLRTRRLLRERDARNDDRDHRGGDDGDSMHWHALSDP